MLRVLFLLALAHYTLAGVNFIDVNGLRVGSGVFKFCHSFCTLDGDYEFMRLWKEADTDFVDDTQIFDWSVDGNVDFWTSVSVGTGVGTITYENCAELIDYYRYASCDSTCATPANTRERLVECRPEWIYIEQVKIEYAKSSGQFHWIHKIADAYQPTSDAWDDWVTEAISSSQTFARASDYDSFDGLLLVFPSAEESTLSAQFSDDFWYRESYSAHYEPNFCSMQLPHNAIDTQLWCNGNYIDDSDNVDYPTRNYCLHRGGWNEATVTSDFGCNSDSECDSVQFLANVKRDVSAKVVPTKTQRLLYSFRNPGQLAPYSKRGLFFTQDDVSGIQFPYCALQD